jgi:hypothetical protein
MPQADSLRRSRYRATNTGKNACATKNARMKAGIAGLKARSTRPIRLAIGLRHR